MCDTRDSDTKCEHILVKIGNDAKRESRTVKFFGITINNETEFDERIGNHFIHAQMKLKVRIRKYESFKKLRNLFKIFFES